jgi:acyl-CoA thioesterase FadM
MLCAGGWGRKREETEYRRELRLGDTATVEVRSDGLSPDVSRWRVTHRLFRPGGVNAARVTVEGSWIDLEERVLALPPDDLADALRGMPRTEGFEELDTVMG